MLTKSRWSTLIATAALVLATSVAQAQSPAPTALQQRYVFPKDSSLKILTAGLLGEQYLGIEPGASEQNLVAGATITQTQSAIVLETLISQFLYSKAADASDAPAAKP